MGNERDVFEWRRFGHWDTSAAKAWFSAYVLWHMRCESELKALAVEAGHQGGDAGLAIGEAFRRESAIALELVMKAVIARKMRERGADPAKEGVPATHDLPKLWSDAGLPALQREDQYRLLLARRVLVWSGRYATPRSVRAWEDENRDFEAIEYPKSVPRKFVFRAPITIDWTAFDRIYRIARSFLD